MADRTLVLVDAGMAAGFRLTKPSLGQLHQALVHLHRQHPDAHVAVLGDPGLKWDVATGEAAAVRGRHHRRRHRVRTGRARSTAPPGSWPGRPPRRRRRATTWSRSPIGPSPTWRSAGCATTAAGGSWDLDATRTLDADQVGPPLASPTPAPPVRLRRSLGLLVAGARPRAGRRAAQEPGTTTTSLPQVPTQDIVPQPNSGTRTAGRR